MNGIITLLSDFATQDGYVGAMKGVILSEAPTLRVVDITHDIPPQDVVAGAFALAQATRFFPPGTVHVAVVDPGVGSERHAIVIDHNGSRFVGPDNGVLWMAAPGEARIIERLPTEWRVHPTFHGRDLFARVAARLAAGVAPSEFVTRRIEPQRVQWPAVDRAGDDLVGQVIHVDRFGNLITNVRGTDVASGAVEIAGHKATHAATYSNVESGRLVAYTGSAGLLEIAVRDGSAATLLAVGRGVRVRARAAK